MPRPRVFERRIRVSLSKEHDVAIRRECALTGASQSEVMRAALAQYFAKQKTSKS